MKNAKISLIIDSICKDLGINYSSVNPHYVTLQEDAKRLSEIYLQLKITIEDIREIEDRHNINGLKEKFDELIKELDIADHEVIRLSKQLREKKDD